MNLELSDEKKINSHFGRDFYKTKTIKLSWSINSITIFADTFKVNKLG